MSKPRNRKNPRSPSPTVEARVQAIAEAVDTAWHRAHGYGDLEVPASVVAGLSLLAPPHSDRAAVADEITGLDTDQFATFMRQQWQVFINIRPDLITPAWPLISVWHGADPISDTTLDAAPAVAHAALRAGQFHVTGIREARWDVDLFGVLLQRMRSSNAASAHGQFYTPAPMSEAMATLLDIPDGARVYEPSVGTGGMLRAAAQAMRAHGRDPASATWFANDIDDVAVACLAVNVVLWELGNKVVIAVANSLTDDWMDRALAQRNEVLGIAHDVRQVREMQRLLGLVQALTEPADDEQQSPSRAGDDAA
ncbi:N-6 DNA methylase [Nocardiopsis sediminis]|uniref:site-specific DNA-methyltransferase (adenine-specific) n=1 Tax=Nocardiopsis sediminis TaxID=1778267 RepID=A0ABV8FU01_9ACTN